MERQDRPPWFRRQVWRQVAAVTFAVFLAIFSLGYGFQLKWVGVVDFKDTPYRTLWDWLSLAVIPAALVLGAHLLAEQQRSSDRERADDRRQDDLLQAYLVQMGDLLIGKRLRQDSEEDVEARMLAQAQTLTVLTMMDAEHKVSVLQFLYGSKLIDKPEGVTDTVIHLRGADLSDLHMPKADLSSANLSSANLSGADLGVGVGDYVVVEPYTGAKLRYAWLADADLSGADMCGGDIVAANLRGAKLRGAKLRSADLRLAHLRDTILRNADLRGANISGEPSAPDTFFSRDFKVSILSGADLRGADLSGALASREDIELLTQQAKDLAGATMPNGQKYEDWIKSQGSGEDGENTGSS